MNCSDIADILDNKAIGDLRAIERREIDLHLAQCSGCMRDWDLHAAFNALSDMGEPSTFVAQCRTMVTAARRSREKQRLRNRLVLIGSLAAVAAAAATAGFHQWSSSSSIRTEVAQVAAPAALPVDGTPASDPADATAAPTKLIESPSEEADTPRFKVRVLPVSNQGSSAGNRAAIDAVHAAVVRELRSVPGLRLIEATPAAGTAGNPADFEVRVQGGESREPGKFGISIMASRMGKDGKTSGLVGSVTDGSPACPGGPSMGRPGRPYCQDPNSLAVENVDQMRKVLFPADPTLQNQLFSALADPDRDPAERLNSLSDIAKRMVRPGEVDFLKDPAVIRAAIDLGTSQAAAAQRAMVWRILRRTHHPDLVRPLIAVVENDAEDEVREDAVVTLAGFLDDARARAAIQSAAETNGRPLVRALAQRALSGEAYWKDHVAKTLKDPSLSDAERIAPFLYHVVPRSTRPRERSSADSKSIKEVLDDEGIVALTGVFSRLKAATRQDKSRTFEALIAIVAIVDHPAVEKMVIDGLAAGSDAAYWISIADAMLTFGRNNSGVRAALGKIVDESPDPAIRKSAEYALR